MMRKIGKQIALLMTGLLLCLSMGGCGQTDEEMGTLSLPRESALGKTENNETVITGLQDSVAELNIQFETSDINGDYVNQEILQGADLYVINVWATYCGPCVQEMPELGRLAVEYESKGVHLLGIVLDVYDGSDTEYAKEIIVSTGADTYPHLLVSDSLERALLSEIQYVPTTFFLDQYGNVLDSTVGSMDYDAWVDMIEAVLENME